MQRSRPTRREGPRLDSASRFRRGTSSFIAFVYDGETVTIVKGKPKPTLASDLREILQRTDFGSGEIHLLGNQRIKFYGNISPRAHQAIRNTLVSTFSGPSLAKRIFALPSLCFQRISARHGQA
ncbi:DUF3634 family protein [Akkermansiaceae bacterium]|nr:DUF3634 family protein [Akkermansiaceae bacterium]MDB4462693.1 DUF3634 family protein [Akkermansiaceae bacterium]MDB4578133.1 DUF3634 family protein [Akkermansiaceae bacterium]